ncbi:MAG: trigger factor, partial [Actinomyces sp.]|nr:trigger factor [Actinomyces sp.]
DLGRAKALIEVLSEVTVKDTAGNDVDLSEFLVKGDEEAAAEAAAETVAEVEEAAAEIADEK